MTTNIMCNRKINELNNLCYPEDRAPHKTIKTVTDLGFRDHISPEKYIKSRQDERKFREKPYSYEAIRNSFGSSGEEYLSLFKKLEKRLLAIGGYEVKFACDCNLKDLKAIVTRGQFLDGRKFKRTQGDPGQCHRNSIWGWEANKDKAIVMCGYALSDDGYWVFHSWLVNVAAKSKPLETTPRKRYAYYGYAMNLEECNDLLNDY